MSFSFVVPHTIDDVTNMLYELEYELFQNPKIIMFSEFFSGWRMMNLEHHRDANGNKIVNYHNWLHMGHAAILAQQYAKHIGLSIAYRKVLWFGTLFHDVDNSYGELTDDKNIEAALKAFDEACADEEYVIAYLKSFDDPDMAKLQILRIKAIIACTQYPFVCEAETTCEMIMRDVDLTMSLSENPIFAEGLYNELKGKFGPITRKEMFEFALSQKFYFPEIKEVIQNEYNKYITS